MKISVFLYFLYVLITLATYANSNFFVTEILNNNVRLSVNPPYIVEGLASQVDIECTFKRDSVPSMASVLTMILGHGNTTDKPEFNFLASVNEMEGYAHNVSHDVDVVSGTIDNTGESKLHVRFRYPETNLLGLYMCEVTGFDQIGKPVSIYSTVNVVTSNITYLLDLLHNAQSNISTACMETCKNYFPPLTYNGHDYYLSHFLFEFNRTQLQSKCGVLGGYLVELDTHDEFSFIRDYIKTLPINSTVYTGATDEEREGVWINEHNLTSRPSFDWGTGRPTSDRGANVQCFHTQYNWFLSDCYTYYKYLQTAEVQYICEVPKKIC